MPEDLEHSSTAGGLWTSRKRKCPGERRQKGQRLQRPDVDRPSKGSGDTAGKGPGHKDPG